MCDNLELVREHIDRRGWIWGHGWHDGDPTKHVGYIWQSIDGDPFIGHGEDKVTALLAAYDAVMESEFVASIRTPTSEDVREAIDQGARELAEKDDASRREQKAGLQELHGIVVGVTGNGS